VLDAAAAAPQMITTPALTKVRIPSKFPALLTYYIHSHWIYHISPTQEKRAVLEANAEGVLEDSDCEERSPSPPSHFLTYLPSQTNSYLLYDSIHQHALYEEQEAACG